MEQLVQTAVTKSVIVARSTPSGYGSEPSIALAGEECGDLVLDVTAAQ